MGDRHPSYSGRVAGSSQAACALLTHDPLIVVREDQKQNILVSGLAEVEVKTYAEFQEKFAAALLNRSTAPTKLNRVSSRSHAVLRVTVRKTEKANPSKGIVGKLHLIDLAGSEDNRRTDNVGMRMKESGAINKSLFVLGKVVDALNQGHLRIP